MSRKNRNARRAGYARPIVVETKPEAVIKPEITMCDDVCGYEYKKLPCGLLETDTNYQRKIDRAQVDRIVAGFDARLVNTVKVSNRDGHFYVFDGAHTLAALKRMNGDKPFAVDCKVFHGLTYEDEAYLFALQTGASKAVAFSARLRALLVSKSAEAEAFRAHTASAGFTLSERAGGVAKNTIAAVAKAYSLYKALSAEKYEAVLALIAATWGGAAWSLTGYMLGGAAEFLRVYGDTYNRDRFIKRLRGISYEELRDEARRQQRKSSDIAHALAIAKAYNRSGGKGTVDPRLLTMMD